MSSDSFKRKIREVILYIFQPGLTYIAKSLFLALYSKVLFYVLPYLFQKCLHTLRIFIFYNIQ